MAFVLVVSNKCLITQKCVSLDRSISFSSFWFSAGAAPLQRFSNFAAPVGCESTAGLDKRPALARSHHCPCDDHSGEADYDSLFWLEMSGELNGT